VQEGLGVDRRDAVMTLVAGTLPSCARAQRTEPMRRIAVLMSAGESVSRPYVEGLLEGLRDHGWQVGKNLQIEYRWPGGDPARARGHATELVALGPELIVSSGTVSLVALRDVQAGLPIVFANITDPVAGGFVSSLARPGGNVTGFTPFKYDIGGKWLQLLKETVPALTHATLLGDPANHNFAGFVRSFTAAAKSLNIAPVAAPVSSLADIERAIEAEGKAGHGGLILSAATFVGVYREQIVAQAARYRLPAIYWTVDPVRAGGLMSYAPDFRQLHRAAATYVDRILKGAKAGDLPVQAPDELDLTVNLATATALGITIPQTILLQAHEVIR
jgi:putative ABC transport system substrate-binding protein